jgi:hypothetical protein
VWDKLRKQVEIELEQLKHLLAIHDSLLMQGSNLKPSPIELSALAGMLHSFYSGIENIFKRISLEMGRELPKGEIWHRHLLENMVQPTSAHPGVISITLKDKLRIYLEFRHVFRQAYTFQLRWEKMAELVLDCEETLQRLESELKSFFKSIEP